MKKRIIDIVDMFVGSFFWYVERSIPFVLSFMAIYVFIHFVVARWNGNI